MSDTVRVEYDRGTMTIAIDRPQARNAVNASVAAGIADAIVELE